MGNIENIEKTFKMFGLETEDDRKKFKFESLQPQNKGWTLEMKISANTISSNNDDGRK